MNVVWLSWNKVTYLCILKAAFWKLPWNYGW